MFTEDSNSGIFGSLKNLFSAKKTQAEEKKDSNESMHDTLVEEYIPVRKTPIDSPTDRPMGTRTVDYSHVEFKPITKTVPEEGAEMSEVVLSEEAIAASNQELDIQFATNLIEKGGKFIYCENMAAVVEELRAMSQEFGWHHVFCWENEIKDAFCENNFQKGAIGFTLENSDAAICLCETLVANAGTMILNPKQASRRRLPVFPKTQIILADTSRLAADLNKAVDLFNIKNRGELPSVLDLTDNVKGHYYHDGNLVLKAEGPSDIYVFLIDEKIKPSTRS
jgi:hypothetical protein